MSMAATPENRRPNMDTERASAREALVLVRAQMSELQAACLKSGSMTEGQQKLSVRLRAEAKELQNRLGGNLEVVKKLMGDRLIVGADYQTHLKLELGKEGRLPVGIEEILGRECPVYGAGHKVFQTHILAWIPAGISLLKLSEGVGGPAGKVLWSDWFTKGSDRAKGEESLSAGKWILIPDKCPPGTRGKNWGDTVEALKEYPQYEHADALSFTTALIMRERKSEQHERHYRKEWAWCKDRWGAAGGGLGVGLFNALGLNVDNGRHVFVLSWFGAAASWNFGNR